MRVESEADLLNLSALDIAEQFTGAPDLQVVAGECETRSQVLEGIDSFEAFLCVGRYGRLGRCDQIRVSPVVRSSNSTAQLMQLREAEAIGAVDNDGIGSGTSMPLSMMVVHTQELKRRW